jgi:hypothetical protein
MASLTCIGSPGELRRTPIRLYTFRGVCGLLIDEEPVRVERDFAMIEEIQRNRNIPI